MSAKAENATVIGVGVAACAVCCAGPILAVLTAIGIATAAGAVLFGGIAIIVGAVLVGYVFTRRRRQALNRQAEATPVAVSVELTRR